MLRLLLWHSHKSFLREASNFISSMALVESYFVVGKWQYQLEQSQRKKDANLPIPELTVLASADSSQALCC